MSTNNYQSTILCVGYLAAENNLKIRFRQDYNDCWIKKTDIKQMDMLGFVDGEKLIKITIPEEVANTLELEGILD